MKLRKTLAGVSAMVICAGALPFSQISAFAADTAKSDSFTEGKVHTYLYAPDKETDIDCRFYANMPSVPYVKLTDFYKNWSSDEVTIKGTNGSYAVTTPMGVKGTIDVNKDTLTSADYSYFTMPTAELSEDSSLTKIFIQDSEKGVLNSGEPKEITIDFSNYDIDLIGDENDVWMPLPTMCNVFMGGILRGIYFGDNLFFVNTMSELNIDSVVGAFGADYFSANIQKERSADLVTYNYNELCRVFDCEYGFPGRIPLNDTMAQKGLDKTLSETNADTKKLKENLLSSDYMTYLVGLFELETYFWDGGHTVMTEFANCIADESLINTLLDGYHTEAGDDGVFEKAADRSGDLAESKASQNGAAAAREALMGKDKEGAIYRYMEQGDTAIFSFDSFMSCDFLGWTEYYSNGGERPDDVVSGFYDCVVKADKNPEIKNFVIDVSTNGGGMVAVCYYMIGLITDHDSVTNDLVKYGVLSTSYYDTDKNLDGKFDEKDKNLKFNLNFGVITSNYSFSCANIFPAMAKDEGLLIIGEQSGGGACTTVQYLTADGAPFNISSNQQRSATKDGKNIDPGVTPDFNLVVENVDEKTGALTKDFSTVFDMDRLSKCFAKYYNTSISVNKLGDPNGDNKIDASDATYVLAAYSSISTGGTLTEAEKMACDVSGDGKVDSTDASDILAYYSYTSTGGKDSLIDFLHSVGK